MVRRSAAPHSGGRHGDIMAIGSGVLISAVAFDLMDEAYNQGGFDATALGFLAGAAVYTAANIYISRRGAKHRKRSGNDPNERQQHSSEGSGLAIAVGALLDGAPPPATLTSLSESACRRPK